MTSALSQTCSEIRRALAAALGVDLDVFDYPIPDYLFEPHDDDDGEDDTAVMVFDLRDLADQNGVAWLAWIDGLGWFHTAADVGDVLIASGARTFDPYRWDALPVEQVASATEVADACAAVVTDTARREQKLQLLARTLKLQQLGHTSAEIATIVGAPIDEVERILATGR
ncbi:hypothetical protein ACQP1G_37765 [Nocardia sp. CA-107356]|uniref:hypothetical protein n=1 Tax=Nocardia sp. CA-107356 TaxID=3239972 RepID=UPI003D8C2F70